MISFISELRWMYQIFDAKCEQLDRSAYEYSFCTPFFIYLENPKDNQPKFLKIEVCVIMHIKKDDDKKFPKHQLECTVNPPHKKVIQDIFELFTLGTNRYTRRFSSIKMNGCESYWQTLTSFEIRNERDRFNELCKQYKIEAEKNKIDAEKKRNEQICSKIHSILVNQYKNFSEKCRHYNEQLNCEVAHSYQLIRGDKINLIKVVMTKAQDAYKSLLQNTTRYLYKATIVITPSDQALELALFKLFQRREKPQMMFDEFSINPMDHTL